MVVALGPGKFYGSGLPRPRFYSDVKFSSIRIDPPSAVMDPLLQWAHEAHWSMGGLSFRRLRLQGRIEGSVKKLRAQQEKKIKNEEKRIKNEEPSLPLSKRMKKIANLDDDDDDVPIGSDSDSSDSEPDKEEEVVGSDRVASRTRSHKKEGETVVVSVASRKRKLMDEFENVAIGKGKTKEAVTVARRRTSPRKKKSLA